MLNKLIKYLIYSLFIITIIRITDLYIFKHEDYYIKYLNKTNTIVYGFSAPRGKILDINGNILVDNIGINNIVYRKINTDEIELSYIIGKYITIDKKISDMELKKYYILTNDTDYLLTKDEKRLYEERKIDNDDIEEIKLSRIENEIKNYTEEDINAIKVYYKMINGYSYDNKMIKSEVSDEECANIATLNIDGLTCEISWKRKYMYDTLNSILGKVGSIPNEEKEYYIDNGYDINDKIGISYLEKQYEQYLKGTKDIYRVNNDNSLTLIEKGKRGNDLYLTIDIKLQESINKVIKKNILKAKKEANTELYNRSYVIVSDPKTGAIISASGISYLNDTFHDVTSDIANSSFIMGSVIKGASMTVGYQNNLINIGKKINDSCVKLYLIPEKCSYKNWGSIDDIKALKTSSNYYQFLIAIKSTGNTYKRNMKLTVTEKDFNRYRDTFKYFGLGTKTGIDLPYESMGIKGNTIAPDLLLNLSIGQYDTYTPLQLTQYINTIANDGTRIKLSLMDHISLNNKVILKNESNILSKIENNRFDRIKEGFRQVLDGGTGRGYTNILYKPAGKTGTSEVVYSKNINTINQTYAVFAPVDNPKYSIVVISPNAAITSTKNDYVSPINRLIAKEVSKIVFENK